MVIQRTALGLTYREIAANLCVHCSTVCRVVQLFKHTGTVTKKEIQFSQPASQAHLYVQILILQLVLQHVGITLPEIRNEVCEVTGVDLAESTICQLLHTHKFSKESDL